MMSDFNNEPIKSSCSQNGDDDASLDKSSVESDSDEDVIRDQHYYVYDEKGELVKKYVYRYFCHDDKPYNVKEYVKFCVDNFGLDFPNFNCSLCRSDYTVNSITCSEEHCDAIVCAECVKRWTIFNDGVATCFYCGKQICKQICKQISKTIPSEKYCAENYRMDLKISVFEDEKLNPRNVLVLGSTASGKSTLIRNLIENFSDENVILRHNVPYDFNIDKTILLDESKIVIFDDCFIEQNPLYLRIKDNDRLRRLFNDPSYKCRKILTLTYGRDEAFGLHDFRFDGIFIMKRGFTNFRYFKRIHDLMTTRIMNINLLPNISYEFFDKIVKILTNDRCAAYIDVSRKTNNTSESEDEKAGDWIHRVYKFHTKRAETILNN